MSSSKLLVVKLTVPFKISTSSAAEGRVPDNRCHDQLCHRRARYINANVLH